MGDRGQVLIKDEGVYLYSHWGASDLIDVVKRAMARGERWTDPEYLARIIFCEMVKGYELEETGFGIGTEKHGDIWRLITIDCEKQTITVHDYEKLKLKKTFQQFAPQRMKLNGEREPV